ncbi:hypothetical protein N0V83_006796 [Neocucurbitaria cava]|uniref:Uncharacterized protein n=1 Tax=Neocucurbitaria cava TaxID=798079 RepID=A0A9W8Y899_9PLEO|nr:hypothetical protein N0V83_006796 [Neocucurbitaria cava]
MASNRYENEYYRLSPEDEDYTPETPSPSSADEDSSWADKSRRLRPRESRAATKPSLVVKLRYKRGSEQTNTIPLSSPIVTRTRGRRANVEATRKHLDSRGGSVQEQQHNEPAPASLSTPCTAGERGNRQDHEGLSAGSSKRKRQDEEEGDQELDYEKLVLADVAKNFEPSQLNEPYPPLEAFFKTQFQISEAQKEYDELLAAKPRTREEIKAAGAAQERLELLKSYEEELKKEGGFEAGIEYGMKLMLEKLEQLSGIQRENLDDL